MVFLGLMLTAAVAVFAYKMLRTTKKRQRIFPFQNHNIIHRGWTDIKYPLAVEHVYLSEDTHVLSKPKQMEHMIDSNVVWVRLGSLPSGDLDTFVTSILPKRTKPFILVTSDGDQIVPGKLRAANAILKHPLCTHWLTQNHDGSHPDKIHPIPIGINLHSTRGTFSEFEYFRTNPSTNRKLRIWGDVELFRSRFKPETIPPLLDGLIGTTVQTWKAYTEYAFVLSFPPKGNLDCYTTWEALYLGAIVIVLPNAGLSPLFKGYRTIELPETEWVTKLNDNDWLQDAFERLQKLPVYSETPSTILKQFKEPTDLGDRPNIPSKYGGCRFDYDRADVRKMIEDTLIPRIGAMEYFSQGHSGIVYRLANGNIVKIELSPQSNPSPSLQNERDILATFRNPKHLQKLIDFDTFIHDSVYYAYMITEDSGKPLQRGCTEEEAKQIFNQIMECLRELKTYDLYHGDISRFNILVDDKNHLTLIDLAKAGKWYDSTSRSHRYDVELCAFQVLSLFRNVPKSDLVYDKAPSWIQSILDTARSTPIQNFPDIPDVECNK